MPNNTISQVNNWREEGFKIYLTSGGFDPLHVGHLKCIQASAALAKKNNGKLVVLVNGDQFLIDKKGKPFMKINERLAIIAGLKGVDLAAEWYDGTQTVSNAIRLFSPDFFTKGGDRDDPTVIPEWDVCQEVGCQVILGIGGEKIQSSSWLTKNM
ncbi:MAG: adenylyltransferase/cytidyltransferase family protein [Rhodobacteraceae bacterium]|nr:adenylyltransferase/cytidyltransferase family protein [Paracoccaceae bacterium]